MSFANVLLKKGESKSQDVHAIILCVLYDATLVTLASSSPATVSNGGNKEKMCRSGEAEMNDLGVKHRFGVVVDASGTITHVMPTGASERL